MDVVFTYQKKLKLLLWSSLILVVICYMLAFRKTIEERKSLIENRNIATEIEKSAEVNEQLMSELSSLDAGLNYESFNGKEEQEIIIELINNQTSGGNLKLIEMPGMKTGEENGITINDQIFTIQGDFFSLLRFVSQLEETSGAGKISSADFFRYTDKKSKLSATRLKLYLQNIKAEKE